MAAELDAVSSLAVVAGGRLLAHGSADGVCGLYKLDADGVPHLLQFPYDEKAKTLAAFSATSQT